MRHDALRGSRALLAALVLVTGCAPKYVRLPDGIPLGANPRQRAQIFTHDNTYELHSLRTNPENLSGVPYFKNPSCEACRVTIPRAQVDSIRVVSPKDDSAFYIGLGIIGVLLVMFTACQP